ncbi:hypothetical protein M413DRAFT_76431 [Hebeloma cylindrosporum]|uniref:Uncharacterized protein n=1 Tax=Hebeloma cylindrosporum TaxID=76867 RepID=A0A0C3BN16_HEBCY|nr:hypothetical protein M413DRAFT_76431 [Hebeloma cylindrosporum h7]
MSNYVAVKAGSAWILATNGDAQEEFVTSFQGIISKMNLPPFTEKISPNSVHVKHLRQSLTVTGLNTATFQTVSENIGAVHHFFKRFIGKDALQDITAIGQFEEYMSIDMGNRYFTPRRDAPLATETPFSADVDPHGYLMNAAGTTLIHMEENEVYYYERILEENGTDYRFVTTKPIMFCNGDIVEVQVSFALLPLREKKFKLSLILRSISLLDATYSQATPRKAVTLKRRVGYADEEIGETRAKLGKMDIDTQASTSSGNVQDTENLD